MSEPIGAALTTEGWRLWNEDKSVILPEGTVCDNLDVGINLDTGDVYIAPAERQPIAALALYGQPFGFTREMVSALRKLSEMAPDQAELWAVADDATDRIESLLPPA